MGEGGGWEARLRRVHDHLDLEVLGLQVSQTGSFTAPHPPTHSTVVEGLGKNYAKPD